MDLSPNDIRNYEFPSQMRGYDKDEVNSFKEQVATAVETVNQEKLKLSMEIDSLKSQLSSLKQFEDTIKSAAIDARRNADMTVNNAKQEAELLLNKAKTDVDKEYSSRTVKLTEIEEQITKLELTKKSYISKVRTLIQSHMDLVEAIAQGEDDKLRQNDILEVTDSAEVDAKQRETVATEPSKEAAIKTEEANAPEEPDDTAKGTGSLTAALHDVIKKDEGEAGETEAPEEESAVDPELAAAIEQFKKTPAEEQPNEEPVDQSPQAQDPGTIVETSARAEDIPPGFVTPDNTPIESTSIDTGKLSMEPNSIDVNQAPKEEKQKTSPDSLAKELDEVAAKFEEEMARAEQG